MPVALRAIAGNSAAGVQHGCSSADRDHVVLGVPVQAALIAIKVAVLAT